MPRPVPPAGHCPVAIKSFHLPDGNRHEIAKALGVPKLTPIMVLLIEWGIARYKAASELDSATVDDNIAAIDEVLGLVGQLEKSLIRFTELNSGVGERTLLDLGPYAAQCLTVTLLLRMGAQPVRDRLVNIKRFGLEHGARAGICSQLGFLFRAVNELMGRDPPTMSQLRAFALAVLEAADIPCEQYCAHPSRMDKLFELDIPYGLETRRFIEELRAEILTAT